MKEKGIEELVQAASLLKAENVPCNIALIGYGDDDSVNLVTNASENNIIQYHGFQKDITPFIKKSTCVVLPSYKEGMSNSLLESAAQGRPLIATDVSGCREVIDCGVNGFLCSARNSKDLFEKMKTFTQLKHSEKNKMSLASRKKVENEFDRDIVVQAMMDRINSI